MLSIEKRHCHALKEFTVLSVCCKAHIRHIKYRVNIGFMGRLIWMLSSPCQLSWTDLPVSCQDRQVWESRAEFQVLVSRLGRGQQSKSRPCLVVWRPRSSTRAWEEPARLRTSSCWNPGSATCWTWDLGQSSSIPKAWMCSSLNEDKPPPLSYCSEAQMRRCPRSLLWTMQCSVDATCNRSWQEPAGWQAGARDAH